MINELPSLRQLARKYYLTATETSMERILLAYDMSNAPASILDRLT